MMHLDDGVHPDEGTIHAWLDSALDARESARMVTHVASCAACASRVAEARGLIAGATRVVGLLDEQPAPLIKPASTPTAGTDLAVWRLLRVTPARASIAALLVVAVGIGLTRRHLGVDTGLLAPDTIVSAIAPVRDSVLNSAVARRLAREQPQRSVAAAPGVAIPTVPVVGESARATNFGNAEAKVLAGRASIVAQRESAGTRADRTRAGVGQLVSGAEDARVRVTVAAQAADSAGRSALVGRAKGEAPSVAPGECYRVESASPATWGSVHLPMIIALDSAGTLARVLTASGAETEARAFLQYNGADSATFRLRRIGFSGSMTLAATGATRTGTMRSTSITSLDQVVTTATGASAKPAQAARDKATNSPEPKAAPPAPAPAGARDELGGAAAIPVTARRVSCPTS